MCGIAGEFTWGGRPPMSCEALRPLVDAMWRRGPDGAGLWSDGQHLTVGNRRLAVMDPLHRANLPITSPDARHVLAYNGELYNFGDLARRLTAQGWRFRTHSDSEVVLAALAMWSERALDEFNGMFAISWYDRKEKRLLLARDHAGIKPLYLFEGRNRVVFGSEFDGLARLPEARTAAIDCDAFADYLRFGHIPAPATLCKAATAVAPGTWTSFSADGGRKTYRYFTWAAAEEPISDPHALDELEHTIVDAVRRTMVSDTPIGFFISGGIDSPLVAAIAAECSDHPLRTYSTRVAYAGLDESQDAAAYASAIQAEHQTVDLDDRNLLALLDRVVAATHEPNADEGMFPSLLVAELAARDVKACLSGDGADELFLGYVERQIPALREPASGRTTTLLASPHLSFDIADFVRCFPTIAPLPTSAGIDGDDRTWANILRAVEYEHYLPSILTKSDRATAHHALEMRVPFLDRRVVEAACAVDPALFIDVAAGVGKLPLRRWLRRRTGLETGGKRSFTAPMNDWLRGPLRDVAEASIARFAADAPVEVDKKALLALAREHIAGRKNAGLALWRLILFDLWWHQNWTATAG